MIYLLTIYFFVSGLLVRVTQHNRLVSSTTSPPHLQVLIRWGNRGMAPLGILLLLRGDTLVSWPALTYWSWLPVAFALFLVQVVTFLVERDPYPYWSQKDGHAPSVLKINMRTPLIWFFLSWTWTITYPWSPLSVTPHVLQAIHVR